MAASLSRLTLYALISAIELDIRDCLRKFVANAMQPSEFYGPDLFHTLLNRLGAEPTGDAVPPQTSDLLEFLDFGDLYSLSRRHATYLPERYNSQTQNLRTEFERLIATRNRVMHSRPLEFDDLARTSELVEILEREQQFWPSLISTTLRIRTTPESVLIQRIPTYVEPTSVLHNLPLPDFDETGFVGRKQPLTNLIKACKGVYPVITVVGEGGLGKTSLALKAAYEILDSKDVPFDAIIFVTAKATQLTTSEIFRIKGAINTSLGLMETAVDVLGGASTSSPIEDLKELLNTFKILLILDNLETVIDNHLKEVLEDLPQGSKILITTRIGLGAFEFPVQLQGLSDAEAVQLLRATADSRGCNKLTAASNDKLAVYCKRMRNNPLHIKWFVSAVQIGKRPEEVLADEKLFLRFCLSNVFDRISENGRSVVRTLLALGGSYTVAELSYLTEMADDDLLRAVQELMRTNMFLMTSSYLGNTYESRYELSQLARSYLSKFYPAGKDIQVKLVTLKNKLVSAGEEQKKAALRNPLSPYTIHTRSRSDWVIAKHLRDALILAKERQFDEALKLVDRAKLLAPDFYECLRVEGWINALIGNASQAYDSYERAIETEPTAANARMMFAGFLLRDLNDHEKAAEQLKIAIDLLPNNPEPQLEYARCCLYMGEFVEAEKILTNIESLPDCHERVKIKIIDLQIQAHCRKADYYAAHQEPVRAIESFEALKAYFESLQAPDDKMFERLNRARRAAVLAKNAIPPESSNYSRAQTILTWIETVSTDDQRARSQEAAIAQLDLWERGSIVRFHSSKKFGFIRSLDGDEFFFHVTSLADSTLLDQALGVRVRFHVSLDYMNRPVAIDIQHL